MAVFKSAPGYYLKQRPGPHRLGNIITKRNPGFVLARLPKHYPITSQQRKVREVAENCGIKPGISRNDLVDKMRTCVGPKMRK